MSEPIKYDVIDENIALVTINRPEVRNAVNGEVANGLEKVIDRTNSDPSIRVCILTGEGDKAFSAGADLKTVAAGNVNSIRTERGGFAGFVQADKRKVWIAAVNGFALGGGCEMVLACDMAVIDPSARLGLPEVKRGLMALAGGLARLPRAIPKAVAFEAIATGEPFDAKRAWQLGLVNHISEPGRVVERALALARSIAGNSPIAVQESLRIARNKNELKDDELIKLGMLVRQELERTQDYSEGLRAFAEKRAPNWTGR